MKALQIATTVLALSLASLGFSKNQDVELKIKIIEIHIPSCNGGDNGSAVVEASGGTAPYEYNWNTFPSQSTPEAVNLTAGTYFIQVTDAMGEVYFTSVHIDEPESSILDEYEPEVGDEVDITAGVTGKNGPYTFELNNEVVNANEITDLPVGIHVLVITDANQCQTYQYLQVYEYVSNKNLTEEKQQGFRINTNKEKLKHKNQGKIKLTPKQTL